MRIRLARGETPVAFLRRPPAVFHKPPKRYPIVTPRGVRRIHWPDDLYQLILGFKFPHRRLSWAGVFVANDATAMAAPLFASFWILDIFVPVSFPATGRRFFDPAVLVPRAHNLNPPACAKRISISVNSQTIFGDRH